MVWKFGVGVAGLALAGMGRAQVTERVSVDSSDVQGDCLSDLPGGSVRVVSADGRYVAFMSCAANLVPGDTNATWDIFLRDRLNGATERLSVSTGGAQGNGYCGLYGISISPDGRYVAFESEASNLVPGDTNGTADIFVRDRLNGVTERVSVATGGTQGNSNSWYPSISADGRYVAFTSLATNLVPGDTNGTWDIFVHDRQSGATERVSVATGGAQGNSASGIPSISRNGRYVAFESMASNLVPGDTNNFQDVFVRDLRSGTTERVSVATGGTQSSGNAGWASISSDGRYVAFNSTAADLVPGDTNGAWDDFVHDRLSGTTERVSVATGGAQGDGYSGIASISGDGRYVAFMSGASNLVPGDVGYEDVFVRDRLNGTTELVSFATGGAQAHGNSEIPSISPDGRYVAFRSEARDLVPGDSNGFGDVFLHDRAATGFTSLCEPWVSGVIACPCSNPPSGSGRGCDNSSSTGGASLSASGIAYLAIDSLAFATSGQNPTALSLVVQGSALVSAGQVYGQGVRCAGGTLKRLYTKVASGGSISAPDFGAGDPTVSARSAAKGDVIQPGQSRWYLVYYRDPNVLGGCDAWRTFNATQTGQVIWWP